MQVVRCYQVKVFGLATGADGQPEGQTYSLEATFAEDIGSRVNECVASAQSDGMEVHCVMVEPVARFVP